MIKSKFGLMALLFALASTACDKDDAPAKAGSVASTEGTGTATPSQTPSPQVDVGAKPKDLCRSLDNDALASILGIAKLSTLPGSGVKGGGGPSSRSCSFYEGGKLDGGVSLGVQFVGETELEKRDFMGRFSWKEFDGLGTPAAIGRAEDEIHLQSVVHGVRVQLRTAIPGKAMAELESTAVEVMKALLTQVPADAADRLAAK